MTVITPPNKPIKGKGTPPEAPALAASKTQGNTSKPSSSDYVALNFSVDAEFRKEFKLFAAMHGVPMTDLLKEAFELIKEKKGSR
jgi:hypothetical protein